MGGVTIREAPGPLVPLGDHWYRWDEGIDASSELRVHAAVQADGRCHLDALEYEGPLSAALLRTIPVGRIEAAVNALAVHGTIDRRATLEARIPEQLRGSAVPGYPDEFYEAVARAYRTLAAVSPRPIVDLAEANEVPTTTAQRWVKEARQRALLPPGRRGKAG